MNSMWKRSFALLLSLVMVFGMMPVNAFAEDNGAVETTAATEETVVETTEATVVETTEETVAETTEETVIETTEETVVETTEETVAETTEETEEETTEETTVETTEAAVVCDSSDNCAAEVHEKTCVWYDWCAELGCTWEVHHADCPWGPCTLTEGCELVKGHPGECTGADTFEEGLKGEGTVDAPYLVEDLEDFKWFRDAVNDGNNYSGKFVQLTVDIDLNNEEWTPIGKDSTPFNGTFDGNGKTIFNLTITGNNSTVGLFGRTNDGEIKNLTVHNASVSGRLNVGVVAGTPYTSKYTNITVSGNITVNGMSYVGGVVGKNAYADLTNITVNANSGSYVKADSVENDTAYRSYVGGVVGFMGEGGHAVSNVHSNIDVIGTVCDVGGISGIAHYNNKFVNCSSSGNVTVGTNDPGDALEVGGIAGVWHNTHNTTVTFTNCSYTGTLSAPNAGSVTFPNGGLVGAAYTVGNDQTSNSGTLKLNGSVEWPAPEVRIGEIGYATLADAVEQGGEITLMKEIDLPTAQVINKTVTINLNGKNISVTNDTFGDGVFHVVSGGDLTINGEGIINGVGKNDYSIAIWADGGKVTINGGTYTNVNATGDAPEHFDLIYVKNGGEVIINGGTFQGATPAWLLNSHDTSKGTIKVYGGTFHGFNPGDNACEGAGTSFLAPSYKATENNGIYTVTKQTDEEVVEEVTAGMVEATVSESIPEEKKQDAVVAASTTATANAAVVNDLKDKVPEESITAAAEKLAVDNSGVDLKLGLEIEVLNVEVKENTNEITLVVDVTPVLQAVKDDEIVDSEPISELDEEITVSLYVSGIMGNDAVFVNLKHEHDGVVTDMGDFEIDDDGYIHYSTKKFSELTMTKAGDEIVAKVGGVEYSTLQGAVNAAGANDTVVLYKKDSTAEKLIDGGVITNKTFTVDLNGYTLKAAFAGTLIMNGGSYIEATNNFPMIAPMGPTNAAEYAYNSTNGVFEISTAGINITAGTVTIGHVGGTGTQIGHKLVLKSGAEMIIPAGKPLAIRGEAIVEDGATLTTNGAVMLEANGNTKATLQASEGLNVIVCNCGMNGCNGADYKVVYVDGVYKLVNKNTVAVIGDTEYTAMINAINAAGNNTITLVSDINHDAVIEKTVTIDLNGYAFDSIKAASNVTVTVKNADVEGVTVELGAGDKLAGNTVTPAFEATKGYSTVTISVPGTSGDVATTYFMEQGGYINIGADGKIDADNDKIKYLTTPGKATKPTLKPWTEQDGDRYNFTHVRNKDGDMLVACDGFFNACTDIVITGPSGYKLVVLENGSNKTSNITVTDGSTKVNLPKEYLNDRTDGTYTVKFTYKDGQLVEQNFVVTTQYTAAADPTNPKTGDGIFVPMFVMFSTAAALAVLLMGKKKHA